MGVHFKADIDAFSADFMFRDEFPVDAQVVCFFPCVDIGRGEEEGPAFFLEARNHFLDLSVGVLMACIFKAVGGDEKNDVVRPVFRGEALLYIFDFFDSQTDRIQKGRAAARFIGIRRKGRHFLNIHMIVDGLHISVKEKSREIAFPFFFLLLAFLQKA